MPLDIDKTSSQYAKRSFRPSWKNKFPWLEYDSESNYMFCILCRDNNKQNAFAKNGKFNIKLLICIKNLNIFLISMII
jgi:hypothetical protein